MTDSSYHRLHAQLKRDACRARFWHLFKQACEDAHGGSRSSVENLPFKEVVDQLAHNGFVMIYDRDNTLLRVPDEWVVKAAIERLVEVEPPSPPDQEAPAGRTEK